MSFFRLAVIERKDSHFNTMPGICKKSVALLSLFCSCAPLVSQAFTVPSSVTPSRHVLFSAVQQDVNVKAGGGDDDDLLSRDRYVAMNLRSDLSTGCCHGYQSR